MLTLTMHCLMKTCMTLAPMLIFLMERNQDENIQVLANRPRNTIDSDNDDNDEAFLQQLRETRIAEHNRPTPGKESRKRQAYPETTAKKDKQEEMEIESRSVPQLKFSDLPEQVVFYLTDVLPFGKKLYISGVLKHGQAIGLVSVEPLKELYFCLRSDYSEADVISEGSLQRAKREIDSRLYECGIRNFYGEFEEKEYVFELQGVPRGRRPYYKVRYPFDNNYKDEPRPDWEGETFRWVFGTTYTPLELFVINAGVKGPGWVSAPKNLLEENRKNTERVLCANIQNAQLLNPERENLPVPNLKVMSISVRAAVPAQVRQKKLFNTNFIEDLHIYAISFYFCDSYQVELKPKKYHGYSRTFFVREFGGESRDRNMVRCNDEKQMLSMFEAQVKQLDPDVVVCHDTSRVLDLLIQRMLRLSHNRASERPRLGRLLSPYDTSRSSQLQRVNGSIAGRLLVDTYLHAKEMIKSVDYDLQEMTKHIKPEYKFSGMSDDRVLQHLNENMTMRVIGNMREEAEAAFALMNHLEILQMTRQLSNICGNTWKRSLENQRAERNEYLIMHECLKRDLIIPDKFRKSKDDEDEETDRKKYQGGHVIEPMKGFYKDFILLLDFNSLYPSIIREYNVCFSKIHRPLVGLSAYYRSKDRPKKGREEGEGEEEFEVVPPPKEECEEKRWGFLPQLIDKIVQTRKACKRSMKTASAEQIIILDIKQKCFKLVANSIYGCLGFSISRFYSKHLAALITRMGRRALLRAKDIVGEMGNVRVIYGDTDSVMIQPLSIEDKGSDLEKLGEIKVVADELKDRINREYKSLEIDVDGIFKPIILLMKKKYVARKLTNYDKVVGGVTRELAWSNEYKGIEVVRRDGFEMQRAFLKRILEILMESKATEPQETYEEIYAFAQLVRDRFERREIKLQDLLFTKQLNKHPKEYNRGETIPHVKVALDRLKAGEKPQALINHTIYYVVCQPKAKEQDSLAKCSFDGKEYERTQKFHDESGPLEIDHEYYKRELVQPVWRVTQHLEDFSTERFMEELGLDHKTRKEFRRVMEVDREEGEVQIEAVISNNALEKCKKLNLALGEIACPCGHKFAVAEKGKLVIECPHCGKGATAAVSNRLTLLMKTRSNEYYQNHFKCRCGKEYPVHLLGDCCKIKFRPKSNIPFELHELVYIAKDLLRSTLQHVDRNYKPDLAKKVDRLQRKVDDFLDNSDFEKVTGLLGLLRV